MYSSDFVTILLIFLLISFVASIPGLWPLIFWIRRSSGDPAQILTERPTLPWWGKGFIGQFLVFLTLSFWVGVFVGLLLFAGEALFSLEVPDNWIRPIRYGVLGGSVALAVQLYQKAAAVSFPPYFNRMEKKALKKLNPINNDLNSAITEYQLKIGEPFNGPMPLTAAGVNFYDPQSPQAPLAGISWDQVICVPHLFTNQYIVLYLNAPVPQALHNLAHGRKGNYYRLYFSGKKAFAGGIKIQALAKHLWAESHKVLAGRGGSNPSNKRVVNCFD